MSISESASEHQSSTGSISEGNRGVELSPASAELSHLGFRPPLTNRGVKVDLAGFSAGVAYGPWGVGESCCIDYLTVTARPDTPITEVLPGHLGIRPVSEAPLPSRALNYDQRWDVFPAGVLFKNSKSATQGWKFELKGSDLAALRDVGIDDMDFLQWVAAAAGRLRVSRLDVAIDFHGARMLDLRRDYEAGRMSTRMGDGHGEWEQSADGDGVYAWTCYLPKKKMAHNSWEKRLRIYDKARQLEMVHFVPRDGQEFTRVELTVKRDLAARIVGAAIEHGLYAAVSDELGRTVSFEGSWWQSRVKRPVGRLVAPKVVSAPNPEGWFQRTAVPGVIRHFDNPDFYDEQAYFAMRECIDRLAAGRYASAEDKYQRAKAGLRAVNSRDITLDF